LQQPVASDPQTIFIAHHQAGDEITVTAVLAPGNVESILVRAFVLLNSIAATKDLGVQQLLIHTLVTDEKDIFNLIGLLNTTSISIATDPSTLFPTDTLVVVLVILVPPPCSSSHQRQGILPVVAA
jgi:hypothetical protein